MDNPEKLATPGTQDTRRKQTNKYIPKTREKKRTVCVGHHYVQIT